MRGERGSTGCVGFADLQGRHVACAGSSGLFSFRRLSGALVVHALPCIETPVEVGWKEEGSKVIEEAVQYSHGSQYVPGILAVTGPKHMGRIPHLDVTCHASSYAYLHNGRREAPAPVCARPVPAFPGGADNAALARKRRRHRTDGQDGLHRHAHGGKAAKAA